MAQAGNRVRSPRESSGGFTLVEVLIALFLIGIGVLAAAPMFIYAMQGNAVGGDFGIGGRDRGRTHGTAARHQTTMRSLAGGSLTIRA